jgi:hypothetical protein
VDLRLFASVLWRFRLLVALGAVLAVALASLAMVSVTTHGIKYRQAELWSSTTRLGVTQRGFPEGRLFAGSAVTPEDAARLGIPVADPNRFNTLAVLYAELATSDPVRRLMRRDGPIRGQIIATPVVVGENRVMLPFLDVVAIATTPRRAVELAQRSASSLTTYIERQQQANNVPTADRVVVEQIVRPKPPEVFQPRSKTMPIVVFLAVMLATVGLAFLLENMRPRGPGLDQSAEPEFQEPARRRSA